MWFIPALTACGPESEPAPRDLREMSVSLLARFDEDEAATDVEDLVAWLRAEIDAAPDGYVLEPLTEAEVEDLDFDGEPDWGRVLGAGVPARVEGTLAEYASIVPLEDQSFADPDTYERWERRVTGGSVRDFLDVGGSLDTWNEIAKSALGVTVPYSMEKDYRWFDGVLAFRSVVPDEGWSEDGQNGIVVGFTVELWFDDDGSVVWYNASWSELRTQLDDFAEDDFWVDQLIQGTRAYFAGTESFVNGG